MMDWKPRHICASIIFLVFCLGGPSLALANSSTLAALSDAESEYEFVQTRTCTPFSSPYQCNPGEEPLPVQWYRHQVEYEIHQAGSEQLHPGQDLTDDVKHAIIESFDAWNEPDCSDFEMIYAGKTVSDFVGWNDQIAAEDNFNLILWQDDHWPYTQNAIALTTVTFSTNTGEILSADVEFNSAQHDFTNSDDNVQVDLRNTLTHEVGHFLGLDHSPNSQATMFATAPVGETAKRTLHDADIAGLCYIYSDDWWESTPENGGGSSGGGSDDNGHPYCCFK